MHASHTRVTGDQAVALRKLVRDARASETPRETPPAASTGQLIVVAGAKGGVGATTIALRMAQAAAAKGSTLLIDANLRQADLAHVASAASEGRHNLADVLAGVCRTHDALAQLQENLQLLPGAWAPAAQPDATSESVARWLKELQRLVAGGETLVLDVGVGMKPWTSPLWRAATQVVLVATPDRVAVLDAYATTKLARGEGVATPLRLLVNRVIDERTALEVHARVDSTCLRFLGESIALLGWAQEDKDFAESSKHENALRFAATWVEDLRKGVPIPCGVA